MRVKCNISHDYPWLHLKIWDLFTRIQFSDCFYLMEGFGILFLFFLFLTYYNLSFKRWAYIITLWLRSVIFHASLFFLFFMAGYSITCHKITSKCLIIAENYLVLHQKFNDYSLASFSKLNSVRHLTAIKWSHLFSIEIFLIKWSAFTNLTQDQSPSWNYEMAGLQWQYSYFIQSTHHWNSKKQCPWQYLYLI